MQNSLDRFIQAQENDYQTALAEVRAGYKCSHWMWYIFPQLKGLGFSSTAQYYGIMDVKKQWHILSIQFWVRGCVKLLLCFLR